MSMINKNNLVKLVIGLVAVTAAWLTYNGFRISGHMDELEVACFDELARQLDGGASPELIFQEDFGAWSPGPKCCRSQIACD